MKRFWNWVRDEAPAAGEPASRTLYLDGVIASESWLDDDVTPAIFKEELLAGKGPVTVWINSPGGDCIAAAQIYNMLMDYPGDVTVKIDGIAASAASVIAMAGTTVLMSPVATMMIHNPLTTAMGNSEDMRKAIQMLDEVKESIINAYEIKTGLSRSKLSHMMDNETWLNAKMAKQLGFCDAILFREEDEAQPEEMTNAPAAAFSGKVAVHQLLNRLVAKIPHIQAAEEETSEPAPANDRVPAAALEKRLSLLKY